MSRLGSGDHRGGLLTQASILSLTSDGTRHRPVHRGKWVLESIYGNPPPPPPPNVSARSSPRRRTGRRRRCVRRLRPIEASRTARGVIARLTRSDLRSTTTTPSSDGGPSRTSATAQGPTPKLSPSGELPDGRTFADASGSETSHGRRPRPLRLRLRRQARHLCDPSRHDDRRPQADRRDHRPGRSTGLRRWRRSSRRWSSVISSRNADESDPRGCESAMSNRPGAALAPLSPPLPARGVGTSMALPLLGAMTPLRASAAEAPIDRDGVCSSTSPTASTG